MTEKEVSITFFTKKGDGGGLFRETEQTPASRVEIPHTIPGDLVLADLRKKRKRIIKGRMVKVLSPSPFRITPPCEHASICGGCSWQAFAYAEQLKVKEKILQDIFKEFLPAATLHPLLPCDDPFRYRNKMEFSFSQNRGGMRYLGLMIARAQHYVFNIAHCHLVSHWFSDVLNSVRSWWETSSLMAYQPLANVGTLRNLTVREGKNTGEKMVVLTITHLDDQVKEELASFAEAVQQALPDQKVALFLRLQTMEKGKETVVEEIHLSGPKEIKEKLNLSPSLEFQISPSSFFQPNTRQAEKLFAKAIEMANPTKEDRLLDLYCGSGAIGMVFSSYVKEVIGIEVNPEAVADGKKNLLLNGIKNFTLYQGDVGEVLQKLMAKENFERPEIIVVDPPRAGLDAASLQQIQLLRPKTLLYISCNPLTQVENIRELKSSYRLLEMQPVDQFPHTPHIENIALLQRI